MNIKYIIIIIVIVVGIFTAVYICNRTRTKEQYNNTGKTALPVRPTDKITLYYTSWCGHSKQFMPEWNKFIKYADKHMPSIKIETIECKENNKEACSQVKGFPTVVFINQQNKRKVYDGERTLEGLIKFVNNEL